MNGEVHFHNLESGWWFQLDREHDSIALEWVEARGAWIGGSGPTGGPINMSKSALVWLEKPETVEDASRIARQHFEAVVG